MLVDQVCMPISVRSWCRYWNFVRESPLFRCEALYDDVVDGSILRLSLLLSNRHRQCYRTLQDRGWLDYSVHLAQKADAVTTASFIDRNGDYGEKVVEWLAIFLVVGDGNLNLSSSTDGLTHAV